jgi:transcriptional regulator with XRE-family HTH domain
VRFNDFSLRALYEALDAKRKERGMSWAEVAREINRKTSSSRGRGISVSTVAEIGGRRAAEGDGVLQMLGWLGRSPESFVPGYAERCAANTLPEVRADEMLRFDTKKLYAALDLRRSELGVTWTDAAKEIGLSATSLTYLAKGGRTSFPQVMRLTGWLGRPAVEFTRVCRR